MRASWLAVGLVVSVVARAAAPISVAPAGNFSSDEEYTRNRNRLASSQAAPPTMNGVAYFMSRGALWRSDGTASGTALVLSVSPDSFDDTSPLALWRGGFVFVSAGWLWRSDGTRAGSSRLAKLNCASLEVFDDAVYCATSSGVVRVDDDGEQAVQTAASSAQNVRWAQLPGLLTFIGTDEKLWKTDGTTTGTSELHAGPVTELVTFGGALYFVSNQRLFRSDGSTVTQVFIETVDELVTGTSRLFFNKEGSLWSTDGTTAEQISVTFVMHGYGVVGDTAFYVGVDRVLRVTDGQTRRELGAFRPIRQALPFGSKLALIDDLSQRWVVDASATAPQRLGTGTRFNFVFDDRLYFNDVEGTWRSDGTDAGTTLLRAEAVTRVSEVTSAASSGDTLYFALAGLQATRGSAGTTRMLQQQTRPWGSLTPFGAALVSPCWELDWSAGVCRFDPTTGEAQLVDGTSYFSGPHRSYPLYETVGSAGASAWFRGKVSDVVNGPNWDLRVLDDGSLTPRLIRAGEVESAVVFQNSAWFVAPEATGKMLSRHEPRAMTFVHETQFQEPNPTWLATSSSDLFVMTANTVRRFVRGTGLEQLAHTTNAQQPQWQLVGDSVFAFLTTADGSLELWRGDVGGFAQVTPRTFKRTTRFKFALGRHAYFTTDDDDFGTELWRSDGTEAGTALYADLNPGPFHGVSHSMVAFVDGEGAWFAGTNGEVGCELWKTDGSGAPQLMLDAWPGPQGGCPQVVARNETALLFNAWSPEGPGSFVWNQQGGPFDRSDAPDPVTPAPDAGPDAPIPPAPSGCGCSGAGGLLSLAALAMLLRRRSPRR